MDSEEAEGKEALDMAPCVPVRLSSPSEGSGPPGVGLSQHTSSCPLSVHFRPDLEPTGRGIHTGLSTVDSEAAEPPTGRPAAGGAHSTGWGHAQVWRRFREPCGRLGGTVPGQGAHGHQAPWERLWALIPLTLDVLFFFL